jgi:hypothetical protein
MKPRLFLLFVAALFLIGCSCSNPSANAQNYDGSPIQMPPVGMSELKILTPTLLELTLITTKSPYPAPITIWNFVDPNGTLHLPSTNEFLVAANSRPVAVTDVGFKRRVLYAPFKKRDLRIGNYLYLRLAKPVADGDSVDVTNPTTNLWSSSVRFNGMVAPDRLSPVIHVNQTGYLPQYEKTAMVGYFLGSMGELVDPACKAESEFHVVDTRTGKTANSGHLKPRPDQGFPDGSYQKVLEADFSEVKAPGEYRIILPGIGASFPFRIDPTIAGAFARTYALGIYHQRCGQDNEMPFTRFVHGPCHTAPAEVPTMDPKFSSANESLKKESSNYKDNPRHTAPQLQNVAASLYPFVNKGPVDVHGGHHDAGDYSKYTCNSAMFIHHLVFASDVFPGVAALDNLGLPESGDGKSDVLQEAKWEADFLARMQDADGGFYFLVYPRDREYEIDVLPDHGDPQIVFPKTTAVTAAAVAALAQCSSSPTFRKQFPEAAASYLAKAQKGWAFLEAAIAKYGKDGAYQKITHYGDDYMHDDELAWAAVEMFLATADDKYHQKVTEWLHPSNPDDRKWGWWRLYDAYGCAIRSYAFAAKAGKINRDKLSPQLLAECEGEIAAAGKDQMDRAHDSAYGTSFPRETKQVRAAGWYFSGEAAYDIAAACQLDYPEKNDPRPAMINALISNLNYEQGCNPVNVTYLTGLGSRRQREIVHQYAQNDRRVLPPTGIPLGNIQAGFTWLEIYKDELSELSFPPDGGDSPAPYPFYDRWGDAFNLSQEFVITIQAKSFAYLAWLMAQSPLKSQPWKPQAAKIVEAKPITSAAARTYELHAEGLDLTQARIVWEAEGNEPHIGASFSPAQRKPGWIEAEAQLPDGRRVFAVQEHP